MCVVITRKKDEQKNSLSTMGFWVNWMESGSEIVIDLLFAVDFFVRLFMLRGVETGDREGLILV